MGIDVKETTSRVKALEKAMEKQESPENIASILKSLKKDLVPTREILKVSSLPTWALEGSRSSICAL
jgi:hypothetical protein